jgi:hypothetical protein
MLNPDCGIITLEIAMSRRNLTYLSILILLVLSMGICSCGKKGSRSKVEPIFRDAFSFYVLSPGPFEVTGPDDPIDQEFLVLKSDGVQLSCGRFAGAFLVSGGTPDAVLEEFAASTLQDPGWLPGCDRWFLDGNQMNIGERWYYATTALVRRNPQATEDLSPLQKLVHKAEIERFKDNEDRIVRIYYAFRDKDIYILTLDGTPEDMAASQPDILRLLASVRLKASEALAATQNAPVEQKN